ncbi:MAG TPA: type II secretion system F family protein [Candidatus Paceibacterota bacterium]|nr:type II secretion system F family protein [Verrucomicrobiota bacterium]HSA09386.1 type II secretion system F family protein [Candidatus Paceibacterota bacterium]
MPLIITPGQLSRRADFYHQLGQLTGAGFGLVQALGQLQRSPPDRSYRQPIGRLLEEIAGGCTLTDALQRCGHWLPAFDTALLRAGEHSGRLDSCFRLLANYYTDRARLARQMIGDLAYPAFLLHFAVFIFPFAQLFTTGNWLAYLSQTLGVLVPIYVAVALMILAAQSRHGETWRAGFEAILHPLPVLGSGRRYLALSRLAAALEALLSAGVTIIEAWELAAAASGSPALRRTVLAWRPQVNGGQTPAETVVASGFFPELFTTQYATGEISGQLDETLRRLHAYYLEEGSRKLHAVACWVPRAVYLCIALIIGYRIIHFYMGYFSMVRDAGGF